MNKLLAILPGVMLAALVIVLVGALVTGDWTWLFADEPAGRIVAAALFSGYTLCAYVQADIDAMHRRALEEVRRFR